ncbi:MAG TPA: CHAT domain-containing protein [Kofleriaceae bacterium]
MLIAIDKRKLFVLLRSAALLLILPIKFMSCQIPNNCALSARVDRPALAISVCEAELGRTKDHGTEVRLADLQCRSGDIEHAEGHAQDLLTTWAKADAYDVLACIAGHQQDKAGAYSLLSTARALHEATFQHAATARDILAIGGAYDNDEDYTRALFELLDCRDEAVAANDTELEGYCNAAEGDVLSSVGYFDAATIAYYRADTLLTTDAGIEMLARQRSALHQDVSELPSHADENELAVQQLQRASEFATRGGLSNDEFIGLYQNLAASSARLHEFDHAREYLERARRLDTKGDDVYDNKLIEAAIAYLSGDPTTARTLDTETYPHLEDAKFKLQVTTREARIALAAGDDTAAEGWARRGIDLAEAERVGLAVEFRPWVLAEYRAPYEQKFVLRSRQGRFADALEVFDLLQGRTFLDEIERDHRAVVDLTAALDETTRRESTIKRLTSSPLVKPPERAALLEQLRGVDFVAVLIAERDIWRITANHGVLDIANLGHAEVLKHDLETFERNPTTETALGDRFGSLLLGERSFRATDEPLYVIFDGELGKVPVAALRYDGQPLVAWRPVLHPPRLTELGCRPALEGVPRATILADAQSDRQRLRDAALDLAAAWQTRAHVGSDATSAALLAAPTGGLLYVGTHGVLGDLGGALDLSDRRVFAADIASEAHGPALVFLAACMSGRGTDSELATSLAYAYLATGAHAVIGTLEEVNDIDAADLTLAFQRHGGTHDPVRALARAQLDASKTENKDWPQFAVFGYDICRKESR